MWSYYRHVSEEPLVDTYGRVHRDLRVSLTDRCSLRCTYCMPHDFNAWLPSEDLLTTDELIAVIEAAVSQGIDEIRLTGGEPLLRCDRRWRNINCRRFWRNLALGSRRVLYCRISEWI